MPYKNKEDLIKYRQTEKHKNYKREYMRKYQRLYKATRKGKEIIHKASNKYNSSVKGKQCRNKNRTIINQIKLEKGCSNPHCTWEGRFTPCMLDFHHIKPETKLFSIGTNCSRSLKLLEEEIKKCTIVCSNCHRQITAGELDATSFPLIVGKFFDVSAKRY